MCLPATYLNETSYSLGLGSEPISSVFRKYSMMIEKKIVRLTTLYFNAY